MEKRKKRILSALRAISLSILLSVLPADRAYAEPIDYAAEAAQRKEMTIESNERTGWPYGPALGAQSAILMEAQTGAILYEKNIHDKLYPASITKILTALITMENCSLDETVTYSYEAVNSIDWQTDSNIEIKAGEQITVEQSLYGLLVGSANEVANALAEHISGSMEEFVKLMNQRAKELGCVDSHFVTTNGIFDEDHYTSTHDMALIAQAFFSNDMLCKISSTANYTIPHSATVSKELNIASKNQLLPGRTYAYEYLVGSKTGYTSQARQTLVSCAQKDGMKLICVVMKEEAPAQFTDTVALFNYGFSNFHMVNVADADQRYTVGSNGFFESDRNVFGNSSSLLSIDPSGVIILPNTAEYGDAQSTLTYDETEGSPAIANLEFTYHGTYVGRAFVKLSQQDTGTAPAPGEGGSTGAGTAQGSPPKETRIYVNVKYVLGGVLGLFVVLYLLLYLVSLISNYSFSRQRKDSARRRRRRRKSPINYDRYSGRSDDL